ncbi:hypothetical protein N7E81_10940 [Reichenbachiella carrageenanivorans]|uniref:Group II intron, maturase-specific domain n=1 Tax=Reichenbachiella carrageenanivorans TaxID=2979869 RepID=A0ABY6CYM7_9BACT|nr:hypothetical protein [Reichenbachiella carrageenanivorans]UXX77883.1 hypothetical protein N7E81_10940 [Reichenbachiella carrageenanivorans]
MASAHRRMLNRQFDVPYSNGYQDIVDIDLKGFFDEVQHYKLLQLIYEKVKYRFVASESSWQTLKCKLKHQTKKTLPYSFEERLQKLKEVYRGWINNFRQGSIYEAR